MVVFTNQIKGSHAVAMLCMRNRKLMCKIVCLKIAISRYDMSDGCFCYAFSSAEAGATYGVDILWILEMLVVKKILRYW